MKKEIGKLLELLNEYEKESNLKSEIFGEKSEFIVISKKFGFIKWLAEHHKLLHPDFVQHLKLFYGDSMPEENFYLMMLAISPNPIEELCKMLRPN